jgi:hypothetical protein
VQRAATLRHALLAACLSALLLPTAAGAAGAGLRPLPASDYQTHPACSAPAPSHASCLALELVPRTSEARARIHPLGMTSDGPLKADSPKEGADGLRPQDLRAAYFPGEPPEALASAPQTIALVDAYNDPEAEADLKVYDREFGIGECDEADGCFEKVNQQGERGNPPFPKSEAAREAELGVCENTQETTQHREEACNTVVEAEGWAVEISTDIEVAHAICQRHCRILLVEADSDSYTDLEAAEETAVSVGGEKTTAADTEVSNSWGGFEPAIESPAFNHPGTVIAAAAGDDGYLNWTEAAEAKEAAEEYYVGADYPAALPHVVAVGGTRLTLGGGAWQSESVWNDDPAGSGGENDGAGGSGCSSQFEAPLWQREVPDWSKVGCEDRRAVADVSADGDPDSGVAVYDSVPDLHEEVVGRTVETVNTPLYWWPIGGTSVASPIIASMFALAGGAHGVAYPAKTLYEHLETGLLHPVTAGGNGECDALYTSCSGSMNPLSPRFAFDCGEGVLICNAAPGYNGPAGVGTPNGIGAFEPGSEAKAKELAEEAATLKVQARTAEEAQERAEEARAAKEAEVRAAEERAAAKKAAEETAATGGSSGNGGGTGHEGAAGNGAGAAQASGSGGAPSNGSSASHASVVPSHSGKAGVRLTGLALTTRTSAVIARRLPTLSQVAFAFTLSAPARVRVTLSRLLLVHGRPRWVSVAGALTLVRSGGRHRAHLRGSSTLAPGRYRLTLTPASGAARSIAFVAR